MLLHCVLNILQFEFPANKVITGENDFLPN
jgi:hypothetical protein